MFDGETTLGETAKIFALSAMISSLQIYNLSQRVKETDLDFLKVYVFNIPCDATKYILLYLLITLQFFTDYATEAVKVRGNVPYAPFGELLFLIRDWQDGDEYGYAGGRKEKDEVLKVSNLRYSRPRPIIIV